MQVSDTYSQGPILSPKYASASPHKLIQPQLHLHRVEIEAFCERRD